VILGIVWGNSNAGSGVKAIRGHLDKLFSDTGLTQIDPRVRGVIRQVRAEISVFPYTQVTPELETRLDSFIKAWKETNDGKLTRKVVEAHQSGLEAQLDAYVNLKYNQLLGLFLDWLIWLVAIALCLFSNILRDAVGDSSKIPAGAKPPFSLARTQLVAWITIIASIYVYAVLWDSRDVLKINATALILMGISAGTFASAAIIDTTEIQEGIPRIQDRPSTGDFLKDILSDDKGVSIHRFQNLVWTIIAIVIYFYRYSNPPKDGGEVLPVLDGTLLALTGISSATYLTMKTRENPDPVTVPQVKFTLALSPASTLSDAEKTALSARGFQNAVITVKDQGGNTINTAPDPAAANLSFLATNINSGTYNITATWTGTPLAGGASHTLNGTWTGQINKATSEVTVPLA
jgi:hypothetical protein